MKQEIVEIKHEIKCSCCDRPATHSRSNRDAWTIYEIDNDGDYQQIECDESDDYESYDYCENHAIEEGLI